MRGPLIGLDVRGPLTCFRVCRGSGRKPGPVERMSDRDYSILIGAAIAVSGLLISCLANAYVYGYLF